LQIKHKESETQICFRKSPEAFTAEQVNSWNAGLLLKRGFTTFW